MLVFGLLIGVFYAVYLPVSRSEVYHSYLGWIAEASAAVLRISGTRRRVSGRPVILSELEWTVYGIVVEGTAGLDVATHRQLCRIR